MNRNKIFKIVDILLIQFGIIYLIAWKMSAHTLLQVAAYMMLGISIIAVTIVFGFDDDNIPNKETAKTKSKNLEGLLNKLGI
jgi:hypothetical protein